MKTRNLMLAAVGLVALGAPALAAAQPYGGYWGGGFGGGYGDYGRGYGYQQQRAFPGYPEFRGEEAHIRREIIEAVREDMIERDDAADLFGELRRIQGREGREFGVHGWDLPDDDRRAIRAELDQLDHNIDEIRDEP
jgi:hypothetical protein